MTKANTPHLSAGASGDLRFVLDPSHRVVFDLKGDLPVSEAVWLKPSKSEVAKACVNKQFSELHEAASWPDDLPERVGYALKGRLSEYLSLARRSGSVISGFDKVKMALEKKHLALLLQASDGADDGKTKLTKIAHHTKVPEFSLLDGGVLGMVMGRDWQVHLGIRAGGLAESMIHLCQLIENYEQG